MNTIVRHIEYLASRRDCVVIPTVGALLARYESARYDAAAHRMIALARAYSFNASIEHNDGELVWSVARSQRIDYERLSCYCRLGDRRHASPVAQPG